METLESDIVTVLLTDEQRNALAPLVREATADRKGVIFFSAAPCIENGQREFRLQAKCLPWKTANKVLKLIRESGTKIDSRND